MATISTDLRRVLTVGLVGASLAVMTSLILDLAVHDGIAPVTEPVRSLEAALGGGLMFVLLDCAVLGRFLPPATISGRTRWEIGSRVLFAAEAVVLGLPTFIVTLVFAAPAALFLTPIALSIIAQTA